MKKKLISILNKLPYVRGLYQKVKLYEQNSCFEPGHFYSPIMSKKEIFENENKIWSDLENNYPIDFNTNEQLSLLKKLSTYYKEIPYLKKDLKYKFDNGSYSYTDGIILYSMIREFQPKRIIEVGSGYTSALMIDVNDLNFENNINLTFIEPYPTLLNKLINEDDHRNNTIINKKVQNVNLSVFKNLKKGDFLFIDSSHVVKTGSDLHYILFKILPILDKGVIIHFHDIFYPFEYPKEWVYEGRNWNEIYFINSFLMYNNCFKIKLFSHYIHKKHKEAFEKMPLSYKNKGGNLWIEKLK